MTSTEEIPLNGRPLTQADIDNEKGTAFDWVAWPPDTSLDGNVATEYPDRSWIGEIEDMIKRDGQAQAVLTALTLPLRMANTTIEEPTGPRAAEITDWVTEALTAPWWDGGMQTSLNNVIGQMTRARLTKRSFHELVITRRKKDDAAVFSKIAWRPAQSCLLQRNRLTGDILGFKQWQDLEKAPNLDDDGYAQIPASRALVYIHGQHVDPLYGHSDMEVAKWAFELKQKVFTLWYRFADRQAIPKTAVYGRDETQARRNAKEFSKLGSAGVVGIERDPEPGIKAFEVLDNSGGGAAAVVFGELIKYLDGMMSRAVMASWLDLPAAAGSGAGSYALSADQSAIFMQGQFATGKEIADTITGGVIARLVRWNFGVDAPIPRFKFEKIDSDQTAKMLALVTSLATAQDGPQVPQGVFDMMVEKISQYLDLDDSKVRKILREEAKKAEEKAQQVESGILGPDGAPIPPAAPTPSAPGAPSVTPTPEAASPDMAKLGALVDGALSATTPAGV